MSPTPPALRVLVPLLLLTVACGASGSDLIDATPAVVDTPAPPTSGAQAPPLAPRLPEPTGECPQVRDGVVVFRPAGVEPRAVRIWMSNAARERDGALVFYWHGTGSLPLEALVGLGPDVISDIVAEGGIVAAPFHDGTAGQWPWFLTAVGGGDGRDDDLKVADEVVACVQAQVGLDTRRIHSVGMSAGGLQTTQMAYRRSSYIASVATYSGGVIEQLGLLTPQEPANHVAALIFHGGANDFVVVSFQQTSERFWRDFTDRGYFAVICNHHRRHTIPIEARYTVWRFFRDHPFNTNPSPYANGLPGWFPPYCALAP